MRVGIVDRVRGWLGVGVRHTESVRPNDKPTYGVRDTAHYAALEVRYKGVEVYEKLGMHLRDSGSYSALKGLRNPAEGVVEFHAAVLWGGRPSDLELIGKKPVTDAVKQVWKWSNFDERGKVAARWFPLHGDYVEKVAKPDGRPQVIKQIINAKHMTDFEKDDRDFFTYVRFDIPSERRNDEGEAIEYLYTEIWRKGRTLLDGSVSDGYVRWWEREKGASLEDSEERMGDPTDGRVLSGRGDPDAAGVLGFDFIPVVHAKFRDIGEPRGVGVFAPHVEGMDEASRLATRLHEMFFRYDRPYKGIKSVGTDATGAPMPQPRVDVSTRQQTQAGYASAGYEVEPGRPDEIELGGEKYALFPANAEPVDLTPNVDYASGAAMLAAQIDWLSERMPELLYYRVSQKGEMSGVALRTVLAAAISRAEEARENLEAAMVRADEMALTIGKLHNLEGFTGLGDYENGDYEHSFAERPILPESAEEKSERESKEADVLVKLKALGGDPAELLKRVGLKPAPVEPVPADTGGEAADEPMSGEADDADGAG